MTDATRDTDPADVDVFEEPDLETSTTDVGTWRSLAPTGLFDVAAADRFLRREAATTVAVVGERGGGKTTLISAIYERLQRGRFAGRAFAGSRTMSGFEENSFLSRAASGRSRPDTPRTSGQAPLNFFHLALSPEERPVDRINLLITERAGEHYRKVRDAPGEVHNLPELRQAAHLVFVIDGGRMADDVLRHELQASVRGLIRLVRDQGLASTSRVEVVATKMDLLRAEGAEAALKQLADFQQRLTDSFAVDFAGFDHFEVTARDPFGAIEVAEGVDKLLALWCESSVAPPLPEPSLPPLMTPLDRYLTRAVAQEVTH